MTDSFGHDEAVQANDITDMHSLLCCLTCQRQYLKYAAVCRSKPYAVQ